MSQRVNFLDALPNPGFDGVYDVTPKEVSEKKDSVYLIDVRTEGEYFGELGHIADSKLIPLDQIPERVSELPKDQSIVFICRSGQRSAQAASFVKDHGIEDVYNLKGGMILWNEKGYPVQR